MKLLLDENISRRMLPILASAFPGSTHVVLEGLQQAGDADVLSVGNCDNEQVVQVLLSQRDQIEAQFADPAVSMVELIRQER